MWGPSGKKGGGEEGGGEEEHGDFQYEVGEAATGGQEAREARRPDRQMSRLDKCRPGTEHG